MARGGWKRHRAVVLGYLVSATLVVGLIVGAFAVNASSAGPSSQVPFAASVDSNSGTLYVGKPHFTKILASGYPKPVLTESGALPTGVTFEPMNGFALLTGTPAAGSGNDYNIMITATNNQGTDTEPYDLTVVQTPLYPPNFCPAPVTVGQYVHDAQLIQDWPYFFGLGLNNDPPSDGLSFNQDNFNGDLGYLSGTPAPGTGGKVALQYSADNNVTPGVRNVRCLLTIDEAPAFTDTGMGQVVAGTKLSAPIGPTGTTGYPSPVTISESGPLPTGMTTRTKAGRKTFAEELLGKPAATTVGDYLLNVTANNGTGGPQTEGYVLVVTSPTVTQQDTTLTLNGPTTTTYGTAASYTATVSGGTAPSGFIQFDLTGANAPVTVPLVDGQATYTTSDSLDVATADQITATYTGDPANASSSASLDLAVTPVPTTIALSGPTSTTFGTPLTYSATVTAPVGTPQGFVEFDLDGTPEADVDLDGTGTATFSTDPTLTGSSSPHEVDATYFPYSDAPGDWTSSDTATADYTIGPVTMDVSVGDGNAHDAIVPVSSGGTVTVDPSATTQISVALAPQFGGTMPPEPVILDIAGASTDDTAALGLTGEEDAPSTDPETGQSDYFWTIAPNTLSGLSGSSATVTLTFAGDDQFAPMTVTFTLSW